MSDVVEQVTRGKLVPGLSYSTPFDASSPWSLVLTLMPESVSPKQYVQQLDKAPLSCSEGAEIDAEIKKYIEDRCHELGWIKQEADSEKIAQKFMQICLRKLNASCGTIRWDSGGKYVNSSWYKGIVRPLTLLRDNYNVQMLLAEFEALNPKAAFQALTGPFAPENAAHIVNYMAGPYCEYQECPELLEQFVASIPLKTALKLAANPSLRTAIMENCYQSPLDIPTLGELSARLGDPQLQTDIAAANILLPTRLQEIREIRKSDADAQFNTLATFVAQYPAQFIGVWENLDALKMVCANADMERLKPLVLQEAMRRGKFGIFKQQSNRWNLLLVQNTATEFIQRTKSRLISKEADPSAAVKDILGACELVNDAVTAQQFKAIESLHKRYGIPVDVMLASRPFDLLERILELQPRSYQQHDLSEQISNATGSALDKDEAIGQFVEFALVDNNFNAAVNFCESMDPRSESTWIAYLQTTKFVSSLWDETPPKILAKKRQLIVRCIEICPSQDLAVVLGVFNQLESESLSRLTSSQGEHATLSARQPSNSKPQKRVKNLFVSGIGWAIGAPVTED